MGFPWFSAIVVILCVYIGFKINDMFKVPSVPHLEETWWGSGNPDKQDKSIKPFKIAVSDKVLEDLKYRLTNFRAPTPSLEGIAQEYGMNTDLLKDILKYWKDEYNWTERQKYLNKFPQFKTNIQGLDIHYIHVKPKVPSNVKILPLLLLHGWPGSVAEFYEIIPILTTPQEGKDFVFEVIAASIPGYGFSQAAVRPGLGAAQIAVVFKNLMLKLGFEKYYAQGGDFGSIILRYMSVMFPERVLGFHSNMCVVYTKLAFLKILLGSLCPKLIIKEEHQDRLYPLTNRLQMLVRESGYLHIQATKPDTIGTAINDSPAGLAAYVLEKFITGGNTTYQTRKDGGLKELYSIDGLIDNLMIYWITHSATTSFRLYSETFNKKHAALKLESIPVTIPTACARFRYDFYTADGVIKEIYQNLLQVNDYEGGHFAAFQLPHVLAKDLFSATEKFERWHKNNKQ